MTDLSMIDPTAAPPIVSGLTTGPVLGDLNAQAAPASIPFGDFEGQDWFGTTKQIVRGAANAITQYGQYDQFGNQVLAPAPTMAADELQAKYGIADPQSPLAFKSALPEEVAQSMHDAKVAELDRRAIAELSPQDFWSKAGRLGAGFVSGALDPANIAAAFIPVVGEARYAAMLEGAGGAFGRAGVRAGVGAAEGVAGQLPLSALRYGFSKQEQADYSASQALLDIAFGGLLGGGLHVVGGAVADGVTGRYANPITQRMQEAGLDTREAVLRGAVAQVAQGDPVDIAPALDLLDAGRASRELEAWSTAQRRAGDEADAAIGGAIKAGDGIPALQARLEAMRSDAEGFRTEIDAARGRAADAIDDVGTDRLQAVETELNSPALPAARRAALEGERQLLTEGRATTGDEDALQAARATTEAEGLTKALGRNQAQAAKIERQIEAATGRQQGADRALNIQSIRLQSREEVTRALAERSIRRYAAGAGVALSDGEAAALARQVLHAPAEKAAGEIRTALASIGRRAQGDAMPTTPAESGADALYRAASGAIDELQRSVQRPVEPAIAAAQAVNAEQLARAPKVAGIVADDLAAAQRSVDELTRTLAGDDAAPAGGERRSPDAAGTDKVAPAQTPLARDLAELDEAAEQDARAFQAAAACIVAEGLP